MDDAFAEELLAADVPRDHVGRGSAYEESSKEGREAVDTVVALLKEGKLQHVSKSELHRRCKERGYIGKLSSFKRHLARHVLGQESQ